jgi:hypothetical protein
MYIPEFFRKAELFSKKVIEMEKDRGDFIWRLIDNRAAWTIDKIRKHFCGTKKQNAYDVMTINNWIWGGMWQYRGFRHPIVDIVDNSLNMSLTSQHCFGRGIDFNLGKITPDEVRQDITTHPTSERYKYVMGIELDVEWVHVDFRNWNKRKGIYTFKKVKSY